jgi:hypothetical protein
MLRVRPEVRHRTYVTVGTRTAGPSGYATDPGRSAERAIFGDVRHRLLPRPRRLHELAGSGDDEVRAVGLDDVPGTPCDLVADPAGGE